MRWVAAGEAVWGLLIQLDTESLYKPAVPLPGGRPHKLETHIHKTNLSADARNSTRHNKQKGKQPKRPSTGERMNKNMVHPDDGILFDSKKEQSTDSCYHGDDKP